MRYVDIDTAKKISKIGLGTWQFGSPEWNYGEQYVQHEVGSIVRRALELGVTLFDTAEIYGVEARLFACRALVKGVAWSDVSRVRGFGRSERILGQALDGGQESAFLATKLYPTVPIAPRVARRAAASADRLGTRRLDLYQIHQTGRLTRVKKVMRSVHALQRAGLVGEVGISNGSLSRWRAAEDALGDRVLSNQVSYSLVARSAERELLPFAESQGRIVIAYSPLAQGLLSGKYDSSNRPANISRAGSHFFLPENLDRANALISTLREVASTHSATPAQTALAWAIRHPSVVAIPGASSMEQLELNVAAADIELADDEYHALQVASTLFSPVAPPASRWSRIRTRFSG